MSSLSRFVSSLLLCVLFGEGVLFSQVTPLPAAINGVPDDATRQYIVPADYLIGPEDVLSVTLYDMPELSRRAAVDSNGGLRLGYLKSAIAASGRTVSELSHVIESRLRDEQIAVDPQVDVSITEVRSRPITVSGSVRRPGVLQAERPLTVLEALLRAGGPDETAGRHVLVSSTLLSGDLVTHDLPLHGVLEGTDARYNLTLKAGDYIRVLPAGQVFVAGSVQHPGAFAVKSDEPLTVVRAMSLAEGWKPEAKPEKAIIVRMSASGQTQQIPVNLPKILARRESDIALQENDVIYVPSDGKKSAGIFTMKGFASSAFVALGYLIVH